MASDLLMSYTHMFEAEQPKVVLAYVHDGTDFIPLVGNVFDDSDFQDNDVQVFIDGEWRQVSASP